MVTLTTPQQLRSQPALPPRAELHMLAELKIKTLKLTMNKNDKLKMLWSCAVVKTSVRVTRNVIHTPPKNTQL